jgi:hypothetical protein
MLNATTMAFPRVDRYLLLLPVLFFCAALVALADTVILENGTSYSGQFTGAPGGTINFTDGQGIQYQFPMADVRSLVFAEPNDTVTLRNGKSYSGHFTGNNPITFTDSLGIKYQFPIRDVTSLVFSRSATPNYPLPADAKVISLNTEVSVRTNESIDSATASEGQTFSGEISEDVPDSAGSVGIPKGSPAHLLIRHVSSGGVFHSPELVLDLESVTVKGRTYDVVTSDLFENNKRGIGKNKRTGELVGGGAALGTLMGAIFGGGKGAAIGAVSGAGGGAATQIFTRGKTVRVPAEATLTFRLEKTLVLSPR